LGTILGLNTGITSIGGLIAPVFVGWMRDTSGSYTLAMIILSLITLVSIPVVMLVRRPQLHE